MKKENVLEVEFCEVFGQYAMRITHQNFDVLPRGKFVHRGEEIEVRSSNNPFWTGNCLYIKGKDETFDENIIIIETKEEMELIKEIVEFINNKYGIPKRWRAEKSYSYFYVCTDTFEVLDDQEHLSDFDTSRYDNGNYFRTEEEAVEKLNQIKSIFLERKLNG